MFSGGEQKLKILLNGINKMFKIEWLSGALISTCLLSTQVMATTCYRTGSTNDGPRRPDLCIDLQVEEMDGTNITMEVSVAAVDGDISDEITWHSDVDGSLGYGQSITERLSTGRHNITAGFSWPHSRHFSDKKSIYVREKNCGNENPSVALTTDNWYGARFTNKESREIKIFWSRYTTGERVLYSSLSQDQSVTLNGYPGNKWIVTDEFENCISVYETTFQDQSVEVFFEY